MRLRKLVWRSVLEPMAVLKDCKYGAVLDNPEDIKICQKLAAEALQICRWVIGQHRTFDEVWYWINTTAELLADINPAMVVQGM